MPKYLVKAHYTPEGMAGLLKEGGSVRRAVVAKGAKELGGSVESMYFAFGADDVLIVVDLPDNAAVAKLSMTASSTGRVHSSVVPLFTVEEIDEIAAAPKPSYTPPGG